MEAAALLPSPSPASSPPAAADPPLPHPPPLPPTSSPALSVLPCHTASWSAAVRARRASYVASREGSASPSSSSSPPPSALRVGSRVILDSGRVREVVHIPAGDGALRLNKATVLLSALVGQPIGSRFAVLDQRGNLQALHTQQQHHTANTAPPHSAAAPALPLAAVEGYTGETGDAGDGPVDDEEGEQEEEDALVGAAATPGSSSVSVSSGGGLLASSPLPSSFLPTATNAALFDDNRSQGMSQADVQRVKLSDTASPAQLISLLVHHSATFHSKTEFSQEKYIAKKKRKYVSELSSVDGSLVHTLEALHWKEPQRLLHLRPDSVAQLFHACNASASRYVLLAESTHGNLAGAFAKRVGGGGSGEVSGLVVHVQPIPISSGAPLSQVGSMRSLLSEEELRCILPIALALLEDFDALQAAASVPPTPSSSTQPEPHALSVFADAAAVLVEGVDSLCVCTRFDCLDLFTTLFPYLRPGGCFVVHSASAAPLASLHRTLRRQGLAVKVDLSDTFYREYQVLPNRTHPHVNMSHAAGYLLSGIKTLPPSG